MSYLTRSGGREKTKQAVTSTLRKYTTRLGAGDFTFGILHTIHAVVMIAFSFAQIFVFARVLDHERYAQVVFLTALAFYFLPLSQAAGRANYVALREDAVRGLELAARDAVLALLLANFLFLAAASVVVPFVIGAVAAGRGLEIGLYVAFCLSTNFLYFDVQSAIWALDLGKMFNVYSLAMRMVHFASVAVLWWTRDFLLFSIIATLANLAFLFAVGRLALTAHPGITPGFRPGFPRRPLLSAHLSNLRTALVSTLAELIALQAPYGLFAALFGVGPVIVAYDTIMKLTRPAATAARIITEIALPRVTRLNLSSNMVEAQRLVLKAFFATLGVSLMLALFVAMFGQGIFRLLLGPNNLMPQGAQYAAFAIIVANGLYQPSMIFLGFNNARKLVLVVAAAAFAGFVVLALTMAATTLPLMGVLWSYIAYLSALALLAAWLSWNQLGSASQPGRLSA